MKIDDLELMMDAHKKSKSCAANFKADMIKFKTIDVLIGRHYRNHDTNYRLLVNHVITTYNAFGSEYASYGFDVILNESNKLALTSVLIYAQRVPVTAPHDSNFLRILENL